MFLTHVSFSIALIPLLVFLPELVPERIEHSFLYRGDIRMPSNQMAEFSLYLKQEAMQFHDILDQYIHFYIPGADCLAG